MAFDQLFSYVCGQNQCWAPGGKFLPFCQRCTGLYVGGVLALILCALFRPRPTYRVLWIHGLLLLLMVPFGYHLVPQNAVIRTLAGQLFAFGLVYYLALNPAGHLHVWSQARRENARGYALGAVAGILALQFSVHLGGVGTSTALAWIGFAGLVAYAALVIANLVVLPPAIWRLLRRTPGPSTS